MIIRRTSIVASTAPSTIGRAMLFALLALGTTGCETTTQSGSVGVNRSQLMLISAEQLDQMAAETYTKLSNEAAAKGDLNPDPAMTKRVRAIAARIEPQT